MQVRTPSRRRNRSRSGSRRPSAPSKRQLARSVRAARKKAARNVKAAYSLGQSGPSRSFVQQIAESIALPAEHPYVRIPSTNVARTAVMTTRQIATVSSPTGPSGEFTRGDILVALFGQPGRAFMAYGFFGSAAATYSCMFGMASLNSTRWVWNPNIEWPPLANNAKHEIEQDWPLVSAITTTAAAAHGQLLGAGVSDKKRYLYMRPGDSLWIMATNTVAAGSSYSFDGKINVWQEGQLTPFELVAWSCSGTGPIGTWSQIASSMTTGVWVSVTVEAVTNPNTAVLAGAYLEFQLRTATAASGEWVLRPYNDFVGTMSGDPVMAERVKVNAAAMLVTNASAALTAQGTILAARIRGTNPHLVTPASLGSAADLYRGKATEGCYTFMENTETSNEFRQCRGFPVGDALCYDLDGVDYFHFMQITNNASADQANLLALTSDASFEFEADTRRYPRRVAAGNLDDLYSARKLLGSKPDWFYENPLHASDIYGFVKKAAKSMAATAGRYAPYAARAASAIDPAGAAGYHAISALLGRLTM